MIHTRGLKRMPSGAWGFALPEMTDARQVCGGWCVFTEKLSRKPGVLMLFPSLFAACSAILCGLILHRARGRWPLMSLSLHVSRFDTNLLGGADKPRVATSFLLSLKRCAAIYYLFFFQLYFFSFLSLLFPKNPSFRFVGKDDWQKIAHYYQASHFPLLFLFPGKDFWGFWRADCTY